MPNPAAQVVLPRRRAGRAWSTRERRFLTRAELVRLLDEVPPKWRPLFELLAATGLRISEAIGLRSSGLVLDEPAPHLQGLRRRVLKAPRRRRVIAALHRHWTAHKILFQIPPLGI